MTDAPKLRFPVEVDGDQGALTLEQFETSFVSLKAKVEAAIAVFEQIARATKAVADRFDEVGGIAEAFGGSIEEASRRTGGMIRQLDLMTASNSLAQRGIELTDTQLANVAVRAVQFAEATGGDAKDALEQLSHALLSGSDRALRPFGIEIEKGSTKAEAFEQSVAQLAHQVGGENAAPDSLADAIDAAINRANDLVDTFIVATDQSAQMERATDALNDAFERLGGSGDVFESLQQSARDLATTVVFSFAEAVEQLNAFVLAAGGVASAVSNGDFSGAAGITRAFAAQSRARASSGITRLTAAVGLDRARERGRELASGQRVARGPRDGSSGGGGGGERRDFRAEGEFVGGPLLDRATSEAVQPGDKDARRDYEEQLERDAEARLDAERKLDEELRKMEEDRAEERERILKESLESSLEEYRSAGEEIGEVFASAYDAAISGEKDFGEALKESTILKLRELGTGFIVEGAGAVLTAIGNTILNPPAAATKYAEGFGKIALGASLGGVAAGLSGSFSGGNSARPERPAAARSQDSEKQGPTTIVFQGNVVTASTEAELARRMADMIEEHRGR